MTATKRALALWCGNHGGYYHLLLFGLLLAIVCKQSHQPTCLSGRGHRACVTLGGLATSRNMKGLCLNVLKFVGENCIFFIILKLGALDFGGS